LRESTQPVGLSLLGEQRGLRESGLPCSGGNDEVLDMESPCVVEERSRLAFFRVNRYSGEADVGEAIHSRLNI
jgi:hypothetical protein